VFLWCKWFSPQVFCLFRAQTLSSCEWPQASKGRITAQFCFSFKAAVKFKHLFLSFTFPCTFVLAWQREMEMFSGSPSRPGFLFSRAVSRYLLIWPSIELFSSLLDALSGKFAVGISVHASVNRIDFVLRDKGLLKSKSTDNAIHALIW